MLKLGKSSGNNPHENEETNGNLNEVKAFKSCRFDINVLFLLLRTHRTRTSIRFFRAVSTFFSNIPTVKFSYCNYSLNFLQNAQPKHFWKCCGWDVSEHSLRISLNWTSDLRCMHTDSLWGPPSGALLYFIEKFYTFIAWFRRMYLLPVVKA